MGWFLQLLRVVGSAVPGSSAVIQLWAEIDAVKMDQRVTALEDPISQLHPDIPELCKEIYAATRAADSVNLRFADEFYARFQDPLVKLEKAGFLSASRVVGREWPLGVNLTEPAFIVYLCALAEDPSKMEALIGLLDNCGRGKMLNAETLSTDLDLPKYVIRSFFKLYDAMGRGVCSGGMSAFRYSGKA